KADGVILAYGGGTGGVSFYLKDGKPKVWYDYFGSTSSIDAPARLPKGKHELRFHFDYDGGGIGKGGTMKILVDGTEVASGRIEKTVPIAFAMETVDVGLDWGRPVAGDYTTNVFSGGTRGPVVVELGQEEPAEDGAEALNDEPAMARQ